MTTAAPTYVVEPWSVREIGLNLDDLGRLESALALSNGHIGLRGNLDEGEPNALPGTYLNSFYEFRPLPYAEAGYGYPESGQTLINVTNGKIIRLLVDDEPFDVRYGSLLSHERVLDLRAGTLERRLEWRSPAGVGVRIASTRLVSFVQRTVAAIRYEVEPVESAVRIVAQSELVANEQMPVLSQDPRVEAALESSLVGQQAFHYGWRVILVHATRASKLGMAAGMDHIVDGPDDTAVEAESAGDIGRVTIAVDLEPGERLTVTKFLAYCWSSQRSYTALRDEAIGALAEARHTGWDGLLAGQREYLGDFWERSDIELDGDTEVQQAVRFALFHTLQSAARAEQRAIPAKGLTGPGYDGHTFWDTERFVLPVLTYTTPHTAADALRWRHSTLDLARDRADQLGLQGAAYPWRTIRGQECSGYWPAGTAAFHIEADIADAVLRYQAATGDDDFEREVGLELLIETARLWRSLGQHDRDGRFRIDGVTGPDEYSAIADNNVYTNLLAQRNLLGAADAVARYPRHAAQLGTDLEEAAAWRDAARTIVIPWDDVLGVHPQSEGFTNHERWNFDATPPENYPLLLHYPYFDLYRKQVVKQADLVLALHWCGDFFTDAEKARDFDYYEELTVRDSSLSASTQAVVAAEVGHLDLAYDYFAEAALVDLQDLGHNTADGIHIASHAGTWLAAVAGFGGMRDFGGRLTFAPRLPSRLARLRFRLVFRDRRLEVEVTKRDCTYRLLDGEPLETSHHGESITVQTDSSVTREIPPIAERPRPEQPAGRQPVSRRSDQLERAAAS
jgi:alpha,alpha-trehalose phosphorylase